MQNSKTQNPNSKQVEPNYQDELDVLEAVATLEKKYGEKLLTDEQKEKLAGAGRVAVAPEAKKLILSQSETLNAEKLADVYVYAMRRVLEKALIEKKHYCSVEEWNSYSDDYKETLLKLFFYVYFGVKETEMKQKLENIFRN
jgi:hypothetical protein